MAKAPKTFQPVVATANALRSGDVVFRTAGGDWSKDVAAAAVAATPDEAVALQAAAEADAAANLVVDLALIPVGREEGGVRPTALRERIRADGPTIALPQDRPPGAAPLERKAADVSL